MPEEWLIDGYNLLHDLRARRPQKNLVLSREHLFDLLASFAASERSRVWMVLDGKGSDDEFSSHRTKFFSVCYSQAVSADTYIERYLYEYKDKVKLLVVTKDGAIARIARGSGARVWSPKEFMEHLEGARGENSDVLFKGRVKGHGFNRPFHDKL